MQPLRRRIAPLSRDLPRCLSRSSPLHAVSSTSASGSHVRTFSATHFPPGPVLIPLTSRKLISVSGPEAAKFLQGVVTANLLCSPAKDAPPRIDVPGHYAAFLTAQGRILHDVFIYLDQFASTPPGESFLIECDADEAANLAKHIKRYKLRAKFNVRLLDDPSEVSIWQALGAASSASAASPSASVINALLMQDSRAPGMGDRILLSSEGSALRSGELEEKVFAGQDIRTAEDETEYTLHRYLHGVPEGQKEILRDTALPHETNLDVMGAIDFRKGCYVGQELTIRTEHRGVVRKRVLPVMLYGSESAAPERLEVSSEDNNAEKVAPGTSIGRVGKKGRSAGKWLAGMGNVGLAICRLETMTDLVLPGESSTGGGGFTAGDEFEVATVGEGSEGEGEKTKMKAFVPDWLREKLSQKGQH